MCSVRVWRGVAKAEDVREKAMTNTDLVLYMSLVLNLIQFIQMVRRG